MNFSSKSFMKSEPTSCAYVGILTTGEPIIFVSGIVNQPDCDWVMNELQELIDQGDSRIVVDFSGVTFASKQWLDCEIRARQSSHPEIEIIVRERLAFQNQSSESAEQHNCLQSEFSGMLVSESA